MHRILTLVVPVFLAAISVSAPASAQSWIDGEMGYRVTVIPEGSPGARHGLRVGDILAEPGPLPQRLRESGPQGVEIPLYRLNTAQAIYTRTTLRVVFAPDDEKRLGLTGDLGFLITAVLPGSLGARAELKAGDFIPKINETFVHEVKDLMLVDEAYEKGEQVSIQFTRWYPESADFKNAISRRRFVK